MTRLDQPYPVYGYSPSKEAFIADMKQVAPQFVGVDEEGNDILITDSHRWVITWLGKIVETPAEIDEEGNIITPATLSDNPRLNLYILTQEGLDEFNQAKTSGALDNLPNGTDFVDPAPTTPEVVLA